MISRLLFFIFTLVTCTSSASAQVKGSVVRHTASQLATEVAHKAPVHRSKGEGQFDFSYFTGIDFTPTGVGKKETYDCAIWIPQNFKGMKIMDMSFILYDYKVLDTNTVKAWVSAELPTDVDTESLACVTLPASELVNYNDNKNDGYNVVSFGEGVTIPEGGCYVGYTITVTNVSKGAGLYPVFLTYEQPDQPGGFWWRTSESISDWTDNYGNGYGNLTTSVTIKGTFPTEALSISSTFQPTNVLIGETCTVPVLLTGAGINPIESFTYTVTNLDGSNAFSQRFKINGTTISLNEEANAKLVVPSGLVKGFDQRRITITEVNDLPNESADNVCVGQTLTLTERLPRKVLFEEITGNRCGWCPRGITAMEKILEQYPEEFIGIAYHLYSQNDPMFNMDFADVVDFFESAPTCMLNRTLFNLDPYYGSTYQYTNEDFGILKDMESVKNMVSEASVVVKPMWNDEEILISTDVTFAYDCDTAPYRLAYAVVEDGISSKKEEWQQANYYRSIYDQLGEEGAKEYLGIDENSPLWQWTQKSIYVKGMVYDNVCLTGVSLSTGIEGSVQAPIIEGQTQTHTFSINMDEHETVMKKKANVRVVAILINTTTGEVVNADSKIVQTAPSAIGDIITSTTEQPAYNLAGQRVAEGYKGLRIVGGKKIIK